MHAARGVSPPSAPVKPAPLDRRQHEDTEQPRAVWPWLEHERGAFWKRAAADRFAQYHDRRRAVSDQHAVRAVRDWRGKLCANCQHDGEVAASRVGAQTRIASKLVAANTCADPGPSAWFAEEEDHLSAFLNSATTQFK